MLGVTRRPGAARAVGGRGGMQETENVLKYYLMHWRIPALSFSSSSLSPSSSRPHLPILLFSVLLLSLLFPPFSIITVCASEALPQGRESHFLDF